MPIKLTLADVTTVRQWIDDLYEKEESGLISKIEKDTLLFGAQLVMDTYRNSARKGSIKLPNLNSVSH
jgi:hypothetical protein